MENNIWENGVVLSFDFKTDKLKLYYHNDHDSNAYRDVKNYLLKNGFTHLKDSDYVNEKIDKVKSARIIREFTVENKWFASSIEKINISPNTVNLDISENVKQLRDSAWEKQIEKEKVIKKDVDEEIEF